MKLPVVVGVLVLVIGAGVATGFGASKLFGSTKSVNTTPLGAPGTISAEQITVGQVYGIQDDARYKDVSEGIIVQGGIDGEGTHHLVRPGGASQTVYLTSSVVDLDPFVGHKVQIKGETFSAQKAAWFMDVGSIKVVELNAAAAETPTTEKVTEE